MRASIIIAAHNEGQSLWKTIRSCIESIGKLDCEILIADDASDDESVEEALRRFPQLNVHRHDQRQGASPTKHLGASSARGEVLVFLDGHCHAEPGAIQRLIEDVERLDGQSLVTPTILALDTARWKNKQWQVGHGYRLELDTFDCGWLPLARSRKVRRAGREFYESPAAIGCAFAVHRELYDDLRGFDPHMRIWGVEDLDFSLKCWLMGHSILHDPEARIGHRFREKFDNYDVPVEHILVNKLRMAYKNFTQAVWSEWLQRCRQEHPGGLKEHPEGLWACVWKLFESERASAEQERAYLIARRERDEFWYAKQFGLNWPRLQSVDAVPPGAAISQMQAAASPSPCPGVSVTFSPSPVKTGYILDDDGKVVSLSRILTATVSPKERVADITFRMGGKDAGLASLGAVAKDETNGTATLPVNGLDRSTVKPKSVTLVEAVCEGSVLARVVVKVVVPDHFSKRNKDIPSKQPMVENAVGSKNTSPVWFVEGDPELEKNEVGLATTWHHVMKVRVDDQFDEKLDAIYDGLDVFEKLGGEWRNINQKINGGMYDDPVGPFWLRLQSESGVPEMRDRTQYVFDKTDPVEKAIIDGWKTADHPDMPIGSDQHDISVRIGGHAFDSVRRRMITRRVAGKDLLQIQWL